MKLLILGGTKFLGRHLVEAALARGHEVTLFNRGQHNPGLFPQVETLIGDRDGKLDALRGRRWNAVIDTSGYVPRIVRMSAELLADAVEHYTFISTVSVYRLDKPAVDEQGAIGTIEDETNEEFLGPNYGPLKALCERAVQTALPGRSLIVRPGLIVGPHDSTDRFTYWPQRVARGGEVLAPGRSDVPIQVIDARDLAEWTVKMTEAQNTGVYNATGPASPMTLEQVLQECRTASESDATFTWVSDAFLEEQKVGPWLEIPLWIPEAYVMPGEDKPSVGLFQIDCSKAIAAGLSFRP